MSDDQAVDKDEEVLKKDEIDALLSDDEQGGASDGSPRAFDFTSQDKIIRGRMPTLEMVHERFIANFKTSYYQSLRKTIELNPKPLNITKFSEFLSTLSSPSAYHTIQIQPLKGSALLVMDGDLVFSLVESYFGGDGKSQKQTQEREFTQSEMRIGDKFMSMMLEELQGAWKPILPVEFSYVSTEVNAGMLKIIKPIDLVLVCQFSMELDAGMGECYLVMPYSMIEPIKDTLDAGTTGDSGAQDETWASSIRQQVMYADVELRCVLANIPLTLKKVTKMKEGDIIYFDMPETTTLYADKTPLFHAKFGVHDEKYAVKILSQYDREGKS